MPLDLTAQERSWPGEWRPLGWGTFEAKPFEDWWLRIGDGFPDLDRRVLQQWMHRHWEYSEYWGLRIDDIRSKLERWPTDAILSRVGTPRLADVNRGHPSPAEEFLYLNQAADQYEPMLSMNSTGTWNMPLLVHHSPDGFIYLDRLFESWHYWLIEGHQRLRYLRALAHSGAPAGEHEVLVLYGATELVS